MIHYGADEEAALLNAIRDANKSAVVRVCVDHIFDGYVRAAKKFGIGSEEGQRVWRVSNVKCSNAGYTKASFS